jgi:hypothetical protein
LLCIVPYAFRQSFCGLSQGQTVGEAETNRGPQPSENTPLARPTSQRPGPDDPSYSDSDGLRPYAWFCDTRPADIALVFLTYCLAVIGWAAIRSNERQSNTLERAHVFAGPANTSNGVIISPTQISIHVTAVNYGRSVGIIREVFAEFSETEPSGSKAIYGKGVGGRSDPHDESIQPSSQPILVTVDPFVSTNTKAVFFFGYIRYNDIFKRWHVNRWCIKLSTTPRVHWVLAGTPVWNEWD